MTSRSNLHLQHLNKSGYKIDQTGSIMSPTGKDLSTRLTNDGYRVFTATTPDGRWKTYVHKMQAYNKFKEKMFKSGVEVRHMDSDRLNNSFSNLSLGTHSENLMDIDRSIRVLKAKKAVQARIDKANAARNPTGLF